MMADWPLSAAIRSVRDGLSARAGLSAFRAGGGSVRDSTWFRVFSEARAAVAARPDELAAPLNRRPTRDEMQTWTTRSARGVLQQIEVFARNLSTGQIDIIPYSVQSSTGVSRQAAIDQALSDIEEHADAYGQVIMGAAHTGAFLLEPGEII